MSTNLYEESPTGVQMAETQQMVEGWKLGNTAKT